MSVLQDQSPCVGLLLNNGLLGATSCRAVGSAFFPLLHPSGHSYLVGASRGFRGTGRSGSWPGGRAAVSWFPVTTHKLPSLAAGASGGCVLITALGLTHHCSLASKPNVSFSFSCQERD